MFSYAENILTLVDIWIILTNFFFKRCQNFLQLCANLCVKNLIRGRKYQFGVNSYLCLLEFYEGSPCLVLNLILEVLCDENRGEISIYT